MLHTCVYILCYNVMSWCYDVTSSVVWRVPMQVARSFAFRQIEVLVSCLPELEVGDREAHAQSPNVTRDEYKELGSLIDETSKVLATCTRKRSNATQTPYEPEPVDIYTPSKFARL